MIKGLNKYLKLSIPILLKYVFLLVFVGAYLFDYKDFIEDIVFTIIIGLLIFTNMFNSKWINNILLFFFILYFVIEGTSYLAISSNFTSSFMYVLIESSKGELKEFVTAYFSFQIILFIILLIFLFFSLKKLEFFQNFTRRVIITAFSSVIVLIGCLKMTGLIESNAYHNVVRGVYGYYQLQNSIKFNKSIESDDVVNNADNDVLVVVIGESTSRGHMQLYGYDRKTTPLLNSIKDSLFVYNNVISTDIITTKSVPLILTSSFIGSKENTGYNIIDVFNVAGYKTYWLSNQRPIGYHDNKISEIASSSYYTKFLNHRDEVKTTSYDEVLLPEFNSILGKKGKKIIFLRLIGTHFNYKNRYPKKFNKFNKINNKSERNTIINTYDNAVLYNDFVVNSMIQDLKNSNQKSAFLYLSDHGENVYDNGSSFFGRTESNLKQSMFEIPFLLWTSENFYLPKDFEYSPDRKFMADHLYESLGHLFGVKHSEMDFSKSIFSKSFQERKRIVVNGLDFDARFIGKNE